MTDELTTDDMQRLQRAFDSERALNRQVLSEVQTATELGAVSLFVAARADPKVGDLGARLGVECAKGCSWCCRSGLRVEVTPPEAIAAAEYIRLKTAPDQLPSLLEGLRVAAVDARTRSRRQIWQDRKACLFLDEGTGGCSIYDARPLGCRSLTSLAAAACEAAHRGESVLVPRSVRVDALYGVARMGLHAACEDEGLDMRPFELANAVLVAFHEPNAAQRWHAGELVFDAAVTPIFADDQARGDEPAPHTQLIAPGRLAAKANRKIANKRKRARRTQRG